MTLPVVVEIASKERAKFGFTRPVMGRMYIRLNPFNEFFIEDMDNWSSHAYVINANDIVARDWKIVEL